MEQRKTLIASAFNLIGGVSGLLSLALIVWNGGTLWQMVHDHDRRITNVEQGGSGTLREHMKQDDERVLSLGNRLSAQEKLMSDMIELKGDVKLITFKIDSMRDKLNAIHGASKMP